MDPSRLTVLSVAYPLAPVAANAAGGAEQILASLDEMLVARGHRSLVIGRADSRVRGELIPIPNLPVTDQAHAHAFVRDALTRADERFRIDVVHFHGCDAAAYLPRRRKRPHLLTLHLACETYPSSLWRDHGPGLYLQCVSDAQARTAPASAALCIENGIATEGFAASFARRSFVAALGRICPEKGYHIALDAAAQAGAPMLLAGRVFGYPDHVRYFADEIAQRLSHARRFVGPVGPRARRRLLGSARALLIPSQCAETSSLVAMEAMASGTPVIAFANGALAHVVEDGRTGFIVNSAREMAEAIGRADEISPNVCRAVACERFSRERMVDEYVSLYRAIAGENVH